MFLNCLSLFLAFKNGDIAILKATETLCKEKRRNPEKQALKQDLGPSGLHNHSVYIRIGERFCLCRTAKTDDIDGEDFYLDLLFYHRNIFDYATYELKLGKFEAKHKGQMELYLKWLDRYERKGLKS